MHRILPSLLLAMLLLPGAAAARDLRAMGDNAANGLPGVVKALSTRSTERLLAGDRVGALGAAREGIAAVERWKNALGTLPPWDGTHPDAGRSLDALFALYPYGEDRSFLDSAGRTFLSLSSLRQRLLDAEERSLSLERESQRLSVAARERAAALSARRTRAEQIGGRVRDEARRSAGIARRIFKAADDLPIRALGERTDPKTAALLEEASGKQSRLAAEVTGLQSATQAIVGGQGTRALPPDDRRMVYFAIDRLAKAGERAAALDAKIALLRTRASNHWKESYVSLANRLLDDAENGVRRGETEAARAAKEIDAHRGAIERLSAWEEALAGMGGRMSRTAAGLRSRNAELRAPADDALARARRSALPGLARTERALRHLAGRAAAEWLLEGTGSKTVGAPPPEIFSEAIGHLEASLP
ncbi:MAG TPA: hypothetical protein VN450_07790, partial [Candidatus Methylomirabilis sp.]|nr:hypothetical protein [Candidatus Methylomirabilis sp.]